MSDFTHNYDAYDGYDGFSHMRPIARAHMADYKRKAVIPVMPSCAGERQASAPPVFKPERLRDRLRWLEFKPPEGAWGVRGCEGWLRTLLGPGAVDGFEVELVLAQREGELPSESQVLDWFDRARWLLAATELSPAEKTALRRVVLGWLSDQVRGLGRGEEVER